MSVSEDTSWPCNQPECDERFDNLWKMVKHGLDEHADPPSGRDPYEILFEEIKRGVQEPDDEVHAYLSREDWGKVIDALYEFAEMQDLGDSTDKQEGRRCRRIAQKLEDQTDAL